MKTKFGYDIMGMFIAWAIYFEGDPIKHLLFEEDGKWYFVDNEEKVFLDETTTIAFKKYRDEHNKWKNVGNDL